MHVIFVSENTTIRYLLLWQMRPRFPKRLNYPFDHKRNLVTVDYSQKIGTKSNQPDLLHGYIQKLCFSEENNETFTLVGENSIS